MAASTSTGWPALAGAKPFTQSPLTVAQADAVAAVFQILSDPVRLRLLSIIAAHPGGDVRLRDLVKEFTVFQPTVSYHLRVLREVGLIARDRPSTLPLYRVVPEALTDISKLLDPTIRDADRLRPTLARAARRSSARD